MKSKIRYLISALIIALIAMNCSAQDTLFLNGTNKVTKNLSKSVSYYSINCKLWPTASTSTIRTISGVGKVTFTATGSVSFTPTSSNYVGVWTYHLTDCDLTKRSLVVMKKPSVVITPMPNQYILTQASTTSAGVYKDSKLIRTLWSNVKRNAGTYSVTWDGKDDLGDTVIGVTSTNTKIRVLTHQMSYQWSANIGNSSTVDTGSHKLRGLRTPFTGVEVGNYIYMAKGTTEGNTPIYKVNKTTPSYMQELRSGGSVDMFTPHSCSDGTLVYWAGHDEWSGYWPKSNKTPPDTNSRVQALIYATKVSDDLDYTFPNGVLTKASLNNTLFYSAIGVVLDDTAAHVTGLAVMSGGNYLYSTHKGKNQVKCYNKTTGALLSTFTLPLAAIAIEGSTLFGIDGHLVKKYTIESNGSLTYANMSISIESPINISFKNGILMVIDGASQQVKAYNSNGLSLWTLGQIGGYVNSPSVLNDKFQFKEFTSPLLKGFLIPQSDSSFWVGDAGNCRTLHFDKNRKFIESTSYLPTNYNASGLRNEPTRIFAGLLEFDLTTRQLVKNWSGNITSDYNYYTRIKGLMTHAITIAGRTFGTIYYYPLKPSTDGRKLEWVELTSTGLRYTGVRFEEYENYNIEEDGSLYYYDANFYATSGIGYIMKRAWNGLNSQNNPTWSTGVVIDSFPYSKTNPYYASSLPANSNKIVFAESKQNTGFHLGRVSNNQWLWMTSKSTANDYIGDFPKDGAFDIGNDAAYAGWLLHNIDSFCLWNYIGEGWKQKQVNKWNLYHQDGLMVMQLGKTTLEAQAYSKTNDAPREAAGNELASKFIKIGSDYYIIHCDESVHGAIHVFKITGLNTLKIISFNYN